MSASIRLRPLGQADLAFADSLRAFAGWNQTHADWQRFLDLEPAGCFVAEHQGTPAGTATTLVHSPELAWIGMVLVHPQYRRRGIGRALLEHCLEHLRQRAVRCIRLDATPAGKTVYDTLGFRDEWTLSRWERVAALPFSRSEVDHEPNLNLQPWKEPHPIRIETLDATAFGVPRTRLLRALHSQSQGWIAGLDHGNADSPAGYAMLRPGSRASYLGPVAANDGLTARQLIAHALGHTQGRDVFWDVPDPNTAAVSLAASLGFTRQRPLIRMSLGENSLPGDPRLQYALSGPETG